MKFQNAFRNRQPKQESSKLQSNRRISLFEWLKQRGQPPRFNSDSSVGNLKMKTSLLVVRRTNGDVSAFRREFHGVIDQVPKHLLKTDAISTDAVLLCLKLYLELQFFCCDS